ncbi:MAG: hypothetical protein ACW96X_04390 [Promethearchaeota archaeon]|jgi:hypothetical protein
MSIIDLYVASISIYVICIIVFVIITVLIYRKYHDNDFLMGIILSGILNLMFLLPLLSIYFFIIGYVLSFLFGYVAGYFAKYFKQGLISGMLGIFLSWLLFGLFSPSGVLFFYSLSYAFLLIIPTIIFGAAGGAIGGQIRERSENRTTKGTQIKENS